ncbi:MAG: hypothetical protein Q8L84_08470 [Hyphomonas sp.]|nr:hypothetical protein [Hyphomonas sp.]
MVSPAGGLMLCTGIDFGAAFALADPEGALDAGQLGALLREIETGRLTGQAKSTERSD